VEAVAAGPRRRPARPRLRDGRGVRGVVHAAERQAMRRALDRARGDGAERGDRGAQAVVVRRGEPPARARVRGWSQRAPSLGAGAGLRGDDASLPRRLHRPGRAHRPARGRVPPRSSHGSRQGGAARAIEVRHGAIAGSRSSSETATERSSASCGTAPPTRPSSSATCTGCCSPAACYRPTCSCSTRRRAST
jgi:hypothetical protein